MIGWLSNATSNFWRLAPAKGEVEVIFCTLFTNNTMEGETTPPTPTTTAGCQPCQVTPEGPDQTLEYKEIIKQIMEKDSKRTFCLACQATGDPAVKEDETCKSTPMKCSF